MALKGTIESKMQKKKLKLEMGLSRSFSEAKNEQHEKGKIQSDVDTKKIGNG